MRQLEGRTAVVAGSTSGIGLAIAEKLATASAQMVINGLETEDQITSAVERVPKRSPAAKVTFTSADWHEPQQITAMIDGTVDEVGVVNVLMSNAGIQPMASSV